MPIKYLIYIIYAKICPEHFSGRARAEGAHGDLDGGQRSSEVKWGKLCAMATIFGQKKPWCKLRMMMTLDGGQRSSEVNGINYVLWLPYLVKRSTDASWEWWWPWWRSKVIRGQMGKLCAMATIFGQKKRCCKLRMMMTLMEVKGHTIFGQKNEGQRSSEVRYGNMCHGYHIW